MSYTQEIRSGGILMCVGYCYVKLSRAWSCLCDDDPFGSFTFVWEVEEPKQAKDNLVQ